MGNPQTDGPGIEELIRRRELPNWDPMRGHVLSSAMKWIAFADEAGTASNASIMMMGGFLSTEEKWEAFDAAWATLLASHNLTYSHAVELLRKTNEYAGWDATRHNAFVFGAHELINAHLGAGFAAVFTQGGLPKVL